MFPCFIFPCDLSTKEDFFQKLTFLLNAFTKKEVASFDFERRKRKRRAAGSTRDVHLRSWRSLLHIQFPLPPRYASRVSSWKLFVWKHFFKGHLVAVCLSRNWSQPWKFILNYLGRSSWTSLWQKFGHKRFNEHCPARSQSWERKGCYWQTVPSQCTMCSL